MMNTKFTKAQIKNLFGGRDDKIYRLSYCEFQEIYPFLDKMGYSSGVYGWQCDYYILSNNVLIATGYNTDRLGAVCMGEELKGAIAEKIAKMKGCDYESKKAVVAEIMELLTK